MKNKLLVGVLISLLFTPILLFSRVVFMNIGTGGVTGTYYPVGGSICRLVNKMREKTGLRCGVESTGATYANLNSMLSRKGEMDFGFVQSDGLYFAYYGKNIYEGKANKKIRSVMAIYPEILTLAVRKDSNINRIRDIKGKKININSPGSGTRNSVIEVLNAYGLKKNNSFGLSLLGNLSFTEGPTLLRNKKMDGYFFMGGHPIATFSDAASSTGIDFVPIKGAPVDALIKRYSFYSKAIIPKGLYTGIDYNTPSIALKAVLATTTDVSEKKVYILTKAILDNFKIFKATHPTLKYVTKQSLLVGLIAPQHPGAIKAFKEAGLLK